MMRHSGEMGKRFAQTNILLFIFMQHLPSLPGHIPQCKDKEYFHTLYCRWQSCIFSTHIKHVLLRSVVKMTSQDLRIWFMSRVSHYCGVSTGPHIKLSRQIGEPQGWCTFIYSKHLQESSQLLKLSNKCFLINSFLSCKLTLVIFQGMFTEWWNISNDNNKQTKVENK